MPLPSSESDWSSIGLVGLSILSLSMIFLLDFVTVTTMWFSSLHFMTKLIFTYNENSSLNFLLYCFFGLKVWNRGNLITSGQTAGHGDPHVLLIKSNWAHS